MSLKQIIRNDASALVSGTMPFHWQTPSGVNVTITSLDGVTLVDAGAATLGDADTLASDALRGAAQVVIVGTSTYISGATIRVGTDAEGYDFAKVRSFDAATKVVVLESRLNFNHYSGASLTSRDYRLEVDTTGWPVISQASVVWEPVGNDALPFTNLYEVLSRSIDWGGLDIHFSSRFPRLWEFVEANWTVFRDDAYQRVKQYFELKGLDIDRAIDSSYFKESMLLEIALMVCEQGGEGLKDEYDVIKARHTDQQVIMKQLYIWIDGNQDLAQTEDEVIKGKTMGWSRGL